MAGRQHAGLGSWSRSRDAASCAARSCSSVGVHTASWGQECLFLPPTATADASPAAAAQGSSIPTGGALPRGIAMSPRRRPLEAPIPALKDESEDTLDHGPRTLLLHQGLLWAVTAFPRDGNDESLRACAQALLLPSRGQRHRKPWHSSLPRGSLPTSARQTLLSHSPVPGKGYPLLAPLSADPALTSPLSHLGCSSGGWEDGLVAQCFLSASIQAFHNLHQHPLKITCGSI